MKNGIPIPRKAACLALAGIFLCTSAAWPLAPASLFKQGREGKREVIPIQKSAVLSALAAKIGQRIYFESPRDPKHRYCLRVQEDFINDQNRSPDEPMTSLMMYVEAIPREAGRPRTMAGMTIFLSQDTEGIVGVGWMLVFDYCGILARLERMREKIALETGSKPMSLWSAVQICASQGGQDSFAVQMAVLSPYLLAMLPDTSDETVSTYLQNAADQMPQGLVSGQIGEAMLEYFGSFIPVHTRLVSVAGHNKSLQQLKEGVPIGQTTIGRWWARRGFDVVEDVGDNCYIFEKTRVPPLAARWENAADLGQADGADAQRYLAAARNTAVWEFLEALDLDDPAHPRYTVLGEKEMPLGTRCVKVEIPPADLQAKIPRGLDILFHELDLKGGFGLLFSPGESFQTRTFYLVYDPEGRLIAILPVAPKSQDGKRHRYCARFFDLSPYYFSLPALTDPRIADRWKEFGAQWQLSQQRIEAALPLVFEEVESVNIERRGPYAEYVCSLGRIESVSKEFRPFTLIEFDKEEPSGDGYTTRKSVKYFNPDEFDTLQYQWDGRRHQIIIPTYPTVYSAGWHATGGDVLYYSALYPGWKSSEIKPGEDVLVIGPGSGLDSWVAWLKSRSKICVIGINPLEIANTKMTARIADFSVETALGNHIKDYARDKIFGGKVFRKVCWNMPFYGPPRVPQNLPPELRGEWGARLTYERETFRHRWDGDPKGVVLREFLAHLPSVLSAEGLAILWNLREELVGHRSNGEPIYAVESIIENAGWREEMFLHYNNLNTAVYILHGRESGAALAEESL